MARLGWVIYSGKTPDAMALLIADYEQKENGYVWFRETMGWNEEIVEIPERLSWHWPGGVESWSRDKIERGTAYRP